MEQLRDVSNILWRERNLLELLAFKLDSERLLARAGRTRWLARADHEVEVVLGALKAVELERGIQVQALVAELGIEADPTLHSLAECVPTEWAGILADHRRALLELARDVDRSARHSRRESSHSVAIAASVPIDERGAVAVSRAVADIVTPVREQTPAEARAAARPEPGGRQRATARPDAVVARLPSLVDFLR
ncbi:MAG: hypothetical protein QOH10_585 [Actinomycetota bacterium]|jgi:hypothetical protein|nr:hypothetical protein [Actinomycetota bacterium]